MKFIKKYLYFIKFIHLFIAIAEIADATSNIIQD